MFIKPGLLAGVSANLLQIFEGFCHGKHSLCFRPGTGTENVLFRAPKYGEVLYPWRG